MRLGYACINVSLGRKIHSLRLATLRTQGIAYLQQIVNENVSLLADTLRWNRSHQIMMFRISSDLVPLGSHEAVDLTRLDFPLAQDIVFLAKGIRLSMHPGQYTLLSGSGTIWDKSYKDLLYHRFLMEKLGINGDIIVHAGGVYGDRAATTKRIKSNILALPDEVRHYLRLENDERSWSVSDLLPICEETSIPLVVDNLHHQLNGSVPLNQLPWQRILATWQDRLPKLHYSEQDPAKRMGAHSSYVTADAFSSFTASIPFTDYDVMLECKAKELALLKLRDELPSLHPSGTVKFI